MYIFEISMKRRIFWYPIRPNQRKKFSSHNRVSVYLFMNYEAQNGINHSIFRKMVFYKQVLEFHCPSKFLCQTSGRQNHWSLLQTRPILEVHLHSVSQGLARDAHASECVMFFNYAEIGCAANIRLKWILANMKQIFICFEVNKTVFIRFIRIKANLHVLQGKIIETGEANICFKANIYYFLYKWSFWGENLANISV